MLSSLIGTDAPAQREAAHKSWPISNSAVLPASFAGSHGNPAVIETMPLHPAQLPVETLLSGCESRRLRRSGPGGQHRNKVETAVQLTHTPSGIVAEANEERSQERNRLMAIHRLRVRLATEHRSPWTEPSETPAPLTPLWIRRTKGGKLSVNLLHNDYPALLAEAMDHVAFSSYDDRDAAQRLGISRTQLLRLLRTEARCLAVVNKQRAKLDLHPLR